jgi:hypothetical protein
MYNDKSIIYSGILGNDYFRSERRPLEKIYFAPNGKTEQNQKQQSPHAGGFAMKSCKKKIN